MSSKLFTFIFIALFFTTTSTAQTTFNTKPTMVAIADFLSALNTEQKTIALLPYSDSSRTKWSNLPLEQTTRKGLQFKDMTETQKMKVHALLRTILSEQGYQKILFIMQYDEELHQRMVAANNPLSRRYGQNNYWVTVFSNQVSAISYQQTEKKLIADSLKPIAIKFEGHHISINLNFNPDGTLTCSPLFTGINPAYSKEGLRAGQYLMANENELGQTLFTSLSDDLKKKAILDSLPHEADVVMEKGSVKMESGIYKTFKYDLNSGIAYKDFSNEQKDLVKKIIQSWIGNFKEPIAEEKTKKIYKHLDQTRFTWMGTNDAEKLHYYRLESPDYILEFTTRDQGLYHFHTLLRLN